MDCTSYLPQNYEIFIPSFNFNKFCFTTDRTSLFIVSFTRVLIYVILYNLLQDTILRIPLIIIVIINILYLGIIIVR